MKHLRIFIPGETPEANAEGLQPQFLTRWLAALVEAFRSASGASAEDIKIRVIKSGSVEAVIDSTVDGALEKLWEAVDATANRRGQSNRSIVRFLRLAPEQSTSVLVQLVVNGEVNRETTAMRRAVPRRTHRPPLARQAIYECRVEEIHFIPREIVLRDEDGKKHRVSCSAEQSKIAMVLGDHEDEPQLSATTIVAPDKSERLVFLRTVEEQIDWEQRLEDHQANWTVEDFLKRRAIDLAFLKP